MKFEEIVSTLCGSAQLRNSNDFQKVFAIPGEKEARLAFDVLTVYGFECKLYSENGESKLYVTIPAADDASAAERFVSASAYANSLSRIKSELDMLVDTIPGLPDAGSTEYSISFANLPGSGGKQLVINMIPANSVAHTAPSAPAPSPQGATQTASPASQPASGSAAFQRLKNKSYSRPKEEENMFSGPSLLSDNNKIISKKEQEKQEADTAWRQFTLYLKGNSAVAASIVTMMLIVLLTVFSMFIVSKGFLCPDLAHDKKKNKAWYCE